MRKIPIKNYFLLLLLFIVTAIVVFGAAEIYNSRTKKQYISVMNSFITEIKLNDLDYYAIDNSPVVIYVSDKNNTELEENEEKYKALLIEYNVQNYFVFLNVSEDGQDVIEKFENLYGVSINKNNLPNLVVIADGNVVGVYSSDVFDELQIIEFLEQTGVVESD